MGSGRHCVSPEVSAENNDHGGPDASHLGCDPGLGLLAPPAPHSLRARFRSHPVPAAKGSRCLQAWRAPCSSCSLTGLRQGQDREGVANPLTPAEASPESPRHRWTQASGASGEATERGQCWLWAPRGTVLHWCPWAAEGAPDHPSMASAGASPASGSRGTHPAVNLAVWSELQWEGRRGPAIVQGRGWGSRDSRNRVPHPALPLTVQPQPPS